jgi:hypothetical protein
MGDSNKMDKMNINAYDIYSERPILDKRSFPKWVEEHKGANFAQKPHKRGKFGGEVKTLLDGVEFDVSLSDRKDSHKSFYIEPTVHRSQAR